MWQFITGINEKLVTSTSRWEISDRIISNYVLDLITFDTYLVTSDDNSCVIWLLRFGKMSATPDGSSPIFCFNLSASFICCLLCHMISAKDSHHSWMVSKLLLNCDPLPCSCCSRFQRINSSSRTRDCKVLRCAIVSFNLSARVNRSCTSPATCYKNVVKYIKLDARLDFNIKTERDGM